MKNVKSVFVLFIFAVLITSAFGATPQHGGRMVCTGNILTNSNYSNYYVTLNSIIAPGSSSEEASLTVKPVWGNIQLPTNGETHTYLDTTYNKKVVLTLYSTSDSNCVEMKFTVSQLNSCTDYDGTNYYKASKIVYSNDKVTDKPLRDYCSNDNDLVERTCNGNSPSYTWFTCPSDSICSNGACVKKTTENTCTDYDGNNIYKKSKIVYSDNKVTNKQLEDYCSDDNTVVEGTCNGNLPRYVSNKCPSGFVCSDGACVRKEPTSCKETDGGLNFFKKGRSYFYDYKGQLISYNDDYCVDSSRLYENYCSGGKINGKYYICPSDYTCSDGACVKKSTESKCTDYDGTNYYKASKIVYSNDKVTDKSLWDYCSNDKDLVERTCNGNSPSYTWFTCPSDYTCSNGACVYKGYEKTCLDNDGDNKYYKGKVNGQYSNGDKYTYYDTCYDDSQVYEYYCSDNTPQYYLESCPSDSVCSNGACVKKEQNTEHNYCKETNDGGIDVYIKGTNNLYNAEGGFIRSDSDYCIDSNKVAEYFCDGYNIQEEDDACPSGYTCSNGACVGKGPTSCKETDGGRDIFIRGRTNLYNAKGQVLRFYDDYCYNSDTLYERYCDGNKVAMKYYTCPSGSECNNGLCVGKEPFQCKKTGDKIDIYKKQTISLYNTKGQIVDSTSDYCYDSNTLSEGYCDGSQISWSRLTCPSDYTCSDGACVKKTTENTCTDYDGLNYYKASKIVYSNDKVTDKSLWDYCSNDKDLVERTCNGNSPSYTQFTCPSDSVCSNGACVKKPTENTCTDYDGYNIYKAGSVSSASGWGYDICINENKVREYYCSNNNMLYNDVTCPSGYVCSNNSGMTGGACVKKQTESKCTDYDGTNYYTASKIVYSNDKVTNKPLGDYCSNNNDLVERTCNGNSPSYTQFTCPSDYTCSNGACVEKPKSYNYTYTVNLNKGWNLISFPIKKDQLPRSSVNVVSTTCDAKYAYDYKPDKKEYVKLRLDKDYSLPVPDALWVKTDAPCKIKVEGNYNNNYDGELKVPAGWINIGGPFDNAKWDTIKGSCTAISGPWSFSTSALKWVKANELKRSVGYFVKVKNACTLGSGASLPPSPPTE